MDSKKNIHVVVATGEWGQDHLKYRRHRLAEFLSAHPESDKVIWVCPSVKNGEENFITLSNGIIQYSVKDIHSNKLFRFGRYFDVFYKGKIEELRGYLKEKENSHRLSLWFTFPGFPYLTEMVEWQQTVYDCSDLWASSISGNKNVVMLLREKSIRQSEERIANKVDTVFCTSDFLHENLKNQYGLSKPIHVLENGVEYSLFQNTQAKKPEGIRINGDLVLGFIGGIKPKLDFSLLIHIMEERKNWHLLLVGPDGTNRHPDFQRLLELQNVTWTGKILPEEVPEYMNIVDVGILPYKASIYNNAVFPLKLFEFLGAGKAVVGMNLPSTRKFSESNIYEYATKNDPETFISLCDSLSKSINNKEFITKRKALAKEKDWKKIFSEMYNLGIKK